VEVAELCQTALPVSHEKIVRITRYRTPKNPQRELLRSHSELRAALVVAGKEIRRLSFEKKDNKVLPILRRTLRESRLLAKRVQESRSVDLQKQFPIIPHESAGSIVAVVSSWP
jgi:hypothetical protein